MFDVEPTSNSGDLRHAISELWERRRDEILAMVDSAIALADAAKFVDDADDTTLSSVTDLRNITHQLIGILGVFGIDEVRSLMTNIDAAANRALDRRNSERTGDLLRHLRGLLEKHPGASATPEDHRPR